MQNPILAWCLGAILISGTALAEENPPSLDDALKELKAAHDRNPGYTAVYEGKGKESSLEYRLALDKESERTASRLVLVIGDDRSESRVWNTADDRWYFANGAELKIARGMREELSSLMELIQKVSKADVQRPKVYQSLMLESSGLTAGMGFKIGEPTWMPVLEGAAVRAADPESITFETRKNGEVTMSRVSGLLVRQSLVSDKGEERVLELKNYQRNSGSKGVESMVRDWPTLGAKGMDVSPMMTPLRLMMFRLVIDLVERGAADLGKLEDVLEEQTDATMRFVKCCVAAGADSPGLKKWREMPLPNEAKIRDMWLKSVPGARADDEEGFKRFMNSTAMRNTFREAMVDSFLNVDGAVNKILSDLFGDGVWKQLKTKDETGESAKEQLGKSLSSAFLQVVVTRRMNQLWGDPEGLE